MMDFHGIRLEKVEMNKLIERFIDTNSYKIDTMLILDLMYENDKSGLKPDEMVQKEVKTPIIFKIAKKVHQ